MKGHEAEIACLAFSKINTNILVSASIDKKVNVWNIKLENVTSSFKEIDQPICMDFSPFFEFTLAIGC